MPRKPPNYICRDRGMIYFRVRGLPKIRIREPEGSPEFHRRKAELIEQLRAGKLKPPPSGAPKPGTWRWLCVQYFVSHTGLLALDAIFQRTRRQILDSICAEPIAPGDPLTFGEVPLTDFGPKAVRVLMKRKKDHPEAANNRKKAISAVVKWALKEIDDEERHGLVSNPARDVARAPPKRQGGHHTWTIEEIEQFERRHPIGTKAHLALTLYVYSGGRRGDVHRLGPQHTRNGRLCYVQDKNKNRKPVTVDIALPPPLQAVIDATHVVGTTTFLVNEYGNQFTKAGFGNKFGEWCREADVPGRGHGLRKAAAVRVADNRATVDQMKAIFGWTTNDMAELYVRAANRRRLGNDAPQLLARPEKGT